MIFYNLVLGSYSWYLVPQKIAFVQYFALIFILDGTGESILFLSKMFLSELTWIKKKSLTDSTCKVIGARRRMKSKIILIIGIGGLWGGWLRSSFFCFLPPPHGHAKKWLGACHTAIALVMWCHIFFTAAHLLQSCKFFNFPQNYEFIAVCIKIVILKKCKLLGIFIKQGALWLFFNHYYNINYDSTNKINK